MLRQLLQSTALMLLIFCSGMTLVCCVDAGPPAAADPDEPRCGDERPRIPEGVYTVKTFCPAGHNRTSYVLIDSLGRVAAAWDDSTGFGEGVTRPDGASATRADVWYSEAADDCSQQRHVAIRWPVPAGGELGLGATVTRTCPASQSLWSCTISVIPGGV